MSTPSRLMLCCLRPLLNPEGDEEYYEVLEVERRCSTAAIKKSYRTMSLRLHPDKRAQRGETVSEADVVQFQRVKEAYETLSEPKRRRIYDSLGELGLKLCENPTSVSPEAVMQKVSKVGDRCRCYILVVIGAAVGFFGAYFPVLAALNMDGVVDVPWSVVMLPIWIVDAFVLLNIVTWVLDPHGPDEPESGRDTETSMGAPSAADEEDPENDDDDDDDFKEEDDDDDEPLWVRLGALIKTCLVVAFQILAVASLDGLDVGGPWVVFAPLLVRELLELVQLSRVACCVALSPPPPAENEEDDVEREMLVMVYVQQLEERDAYRRAARLVFSRVAFEALLALKLDGVDLSWWLVFFPVWLQAALYAARALTFLAASRSIRRTMSSESRPRDDEEESARNDDDDEHLSDEDKLKAEAASQAAASACNAACVSFCLVAVAVLVVVRLLRQRQPYYSALVPFAPVLLNVCCCYCCTASFVCCFRSVDGLDDQPPPSDRDRQDDDQQRPPAAAVESQVEDEHRTEAAPEPVQPKLNVDSPLVAAARPTDVKPADTTVLLSDLD